MARMYILKALQLAKDGETEDARSRREKTLYERLLKCHLHEAQFDEARDMLDKISDESFRARVRQTLDVVSSWTIDNVEHHRKMLLDRVPRFKADLCVSCLS